MKDVLTEAKAIERYKCTASKNGGWCDGTKRGLRMGCPHHGLTMDRERICDLGIQAGFDEMDRMAASGEYLQGRES